MDNLDSPDPDYQDTYQLLPELAKLRDALATLPIRHRLAFPLCCCERLYPSYQALAAFLQTLDVLRPILDRLWKHILGQDLTETEVEHGLATCLSIPLGEPGCRAYAGGAEDAVGAAYVTVDACRQHLLDKVVRAAELARNKVNRPLWKELAGQVVGGVGPDEHQQIESAIRSHPTMVAEIEKEAAQLRFLYECKKLTEDAVAQLLGL